MCNIVVREMQPQELARVQEIFAAVYSETFSKEVPSFLDVTQGEKIYVALLNRAIVGIATVWEPDAFVHFLLVDSAARRNGVGRTVIRALAEAYETPLTLKCLVGNTKALQFYRATGWRELKKGYSEEGHYVLLIYSGTQQRP